MAQVATKVKVSRFMPASKVAKRLLTIPVRMKR